MPVAVLDIEFDRIPAKVSGLDNYSHALVVIRLNGAPVGQTRLPVFNGCISGASLRTAMLEGAGWNFWQQWLYNYLDWNARDDLDVSVPSATVAVCTRDRPEDLQNCLNALMQMPDDGQEILVIDNCSSTDATYRLVEQYERVRYIRENRPGLNNARNRALCEAKHEIVAFTDDDATPDPNWLRALLRNYSHPLTLCVTGLTMPKELDTESQEWFEREVPFRRGFNHRIYDRTFTNPLSGGKTGAGVNMSFRRTVIDCVGFFDEALDAGTPTHSGGDNEMFSRILAAGYQIVYEPEALVWHRHRRNWPELRTQLYGYGVANFAILTRYLFLEGEWSAILQGWRWIFRQFNKLSRTLLRRPGSMPLDLNLAFLCGFMIGPFAYVYSRYYFRNRNCANE